MGGKNLSLHCVGASCNVQMFIRLSIFQFLIHRRNANYLKDRDFNRDSNFWASYTHILILHSIVYLNV